MRILFYTYKSFISGSALQPMKSQNAIQRIYSLFEHACYELFKNYGHNIQRVYGSGFETSDLPCARIDGGNDDFEILIAVHMPFSTLAQTYPVGGPHTIAEDELEDWVSELSNRLLGKLNAQMALHNCPLKSGLPEFSLGSQNDFYQLSKGTLNQFLFILEGEMFGMHISIESFKDEVNFTAQVQAQTNTISDGDIEFF